MKYTLATLASLAALVAAAPQAVTSQLAPAGAPVCSPDYSGSFQLSVVNASTVVGSKAKRTSGGALILTLVGGILKDADGRIGYIASNRQFQFDGPPQAGAIYTAGFSVCSNSTLALASTIFYECLSGDFYNLYDRPAESSCYPIFLDTVPYSGSGVVSAASTSVVAPVTQITDGQPQATSAAVITQITDGQVQGPTTAAVITQITDGQVQAPTTTAAVITQITDGQVQAPTTTAAVITQITDGQVQAPTTTAAVITQITDGQVQAPTTTAPVITQITDGQIQAPPNATSPAPVIPPISGAANPAGQSFAVVAAGVVFLGVALL